MLTRLALEFKTKQNACMAEMPLSISRRPAMTSIRSDAFSGDALKAARKRPKLRALLKSRRQRLHRRSLWKFETTLQMPSRRSRALKFSMVMVHGGRVLSCALMFRAPNRQSVLLSSNTMTSAGAKPGPTSSQKRRPKLTAQTSPGWRWHPTPSI